MNPYQAERCEEPIESPAEPSRMSQAVMAIVIVAVMLLVGIFLIPPV